MARPLTRRQREVLEAIHQYQTEHSLAPTLEEIGRRFGVNRVTIYKHVQALIHKGYLENLTPGASRALDLTAVSQALLAPGLPFDSAEGSGLPEQAEEQSARRLPLLGRIAAGRPIEAVEDPEHLEFTDLVPPGDDLYLLRVTGDSMIEDNIQDGDLVIVRRDTQPHEGDIVIAILDDEEATLKRLYKEKEGYRLQPANSSLQPRYVRQVEVRGVVTGVIRRF